MRVQTTHTFSVCPPHVHSVVYVIRVVVERILPLRQNIPFKWAIGRAQTYRRADGGSDEVSAKRVLSVSHSNESAYTRVDASTECFACIFFPCECSEFV